MSVQNEAQSSVESLQLLLGGSGSGDRRPPDSVHYSSAQRSSSSGGLLFVLRLIGAIAATVLAGPVFNSFSSVAALFVENGVFHGGCGSVANGMCALQNTKTQALAYISMGSSLLSLLGAGIAVDRVGTRVTAIVGSVSVALGLFLVWVGLFWGAAEPLLWVAFAVVSAGSAFNSFAVYSFMHHTRYQVVIFGLANAAYASSTAMLYLVERLVPFIGLPYGMLVLCGGAVLAIVLCFVCLPTQAEFFEAARRRGELVTEDAGEASVKRQLREAWHVLKAEGRMNAVVCLVLALPIYIFITYVAGASFPYNVQLTSEQVASDVADIAPLLALVSVLTGAGTGFLIDSISFRRSTPVLVLLVAVNFIFFIGNEAALIASSIALSALFSMWLNYTSKWPVLYAPPHLFGIFYGGFGTLAGIVQLAFNTLLGYIMTLLVAPSKELYQIPFAALGGISIVSGVVTSVYIWRHARTHYVDSAGVVSTKFQPLAGSVEEEVE